MNCFRSLYLWVDLQLFQQSFERMLRCELLSFFVPLGWFTAMGWNWHCCRPLWIAFVLCTFGLIYSELASELLRCQLWIAFVLCTFGLIYSGPQGEPGPKGVVNCFRSLYLWVDLQLFTSLAAGRRVVNCFRSLYLWVDLQPVSLSIITGNSCELLSFFVPLGWFTACWPCA